MSDTRPQLPRLVVEMWWCGDDVCDCTMPRVCRYTRNERLHWAVNTEVIESGPFYSAASREEYQEQIAWLRDAAQRYPEAVVEGWAQEVEA